MRFNRQQEFLCILILCGKNCMPTIYKVVLPYANWTPRHTTKPPDSLGVCNIMTWLWTTGKLFYAMTSLSTRSFIRMGVLGFVECQASVCYLSASFNHQIWWWWYTSLEVVLWYGQEPLQAFLVNWTSTWTWTFWTIRFFLTSGDFIKWTKLIHFRDDNAACHGATSVIF